MHLTGFDGSLMAIAPELERYPYRQTNRGLNGDRAMLRSAIGFGDTGSGAQGMEVTEYRNDRVVVTYKQLNSELELRDRGPVDYRSRNG